MNHLDPPLLPTPEASRAGGTAEGHRERKRRSMGRTDPTCTNLDLVVEELAEKAALLPTPACNDMGANYTPETWDAWTARMKAEHNNGNGHGDSLNIEAQRLGELLPSPQASEGRKGTLAGVGRDGHQTYLSEAIGSLLPTTTTTDAKASGAADYTTGHAGTTLTDATVRQPSRWGKYAAAIQQWERLTRPAPEPTHLTAGYLKSLMKRRSRLDKRPVGMRGSLRPRRQLAARFSEWMMGVPLGWITDVPGITRNEALKAAGNGVVPQQAAWAMRYLLTMPTGRQIADAHEPVDLLELLMQDGAT